MTSNDEEGSNLPLAKKRKMIQRACDGCKKKKTRCDGPKPPHDKCSNCTLNNVDCTYETERKKRGRPKGYFDRVERRIKLLEDLVKKLCPDQSVLYSFIAPLDPDYASYLTNISAPSSISSSSSTCKNTLATSDSPATSAETEPTTAEIDIIHRMAVVSLRSEEDPVRQNDSEHLKLSETIKLLSRKTEDKRYWGKSSGAMFLQSAISLKNEYSNDTSIKRNILQAMRPMYWKRPPWEQDYCLLHKPTVKYIFPPSDLIMKLADAYFEHVNIFYPLLHRPTFERAVANDLHIRDEGFGGVVLLVCAVGTRYVEKIDQSMLPDGIDSSLAAGWKWYSQVQVVKHKLIATPTLCEMQSYCLAIEFFRGCNAPHATWILVGFALRLAQEVGAYRRPVPHEKLTVEIELWKRVYWVLVAKDRIVSMAVGRQCAMFGDYFDVDMPVECDDEYWEHPDPSQRFQQPKGIPSTVTAFNHLLRLNKIIEFALNTIYSIKTKMWESILQQWEEHVVSELDSALNNWFNSLPEYLRWNPKRSDGPFFKLTGHLVVYYYHIQILIHRPYLRAKGHLSPLLLPSVAICSNAARSCSLVLAEQMKRTSVIHHYMLMAAVPTATVLILNIWSSRRSGMDADPNTVRHIEVCLNVLKRAQERWRSAGMHLDVLNELASAGELIISEEEPSVMDDLDLWNKMAHSSSGTEWSPNSFINRNEEEGSFSSSESGASSSFLPHSKPLYPVQHLHLHSMSDTPNHEIGYSGGAGQAYLQASILASHNVPYPNVSTSSDSRSNHGSIPSNFNPDEQSARYNHRHFEQQPCADFPIQSSAYWSRSHSGNQITAQHSSSGDAVDTIELSRPYLNAMAPTSQQQVDSNTMTLHNTPGFEFYEWDKFLANFRELTEELSNTHHTDGQESTRTY